MSDEIVEVKTHYELHSILFIWRTGNIRSLLSRLSKTSVLCPMVHYSQVSWCVRSWHLLASKDLVYIYMYVCMHDNNTDICLSL